MVFEMTKRLRARKGRRLARGTVMVESLVVLIVMIVAVGAGMLFYVIFTTKIFTMLKADNDAWSQALPGCSGGGLGGLLEGPSALIGAVNGDPERQDLGSLGLTVGAKIGSDSKAV